MLKYFQKKKKKKKDTHLNLPLKNIFTITNLSFLIYPWLILAKNKKTNKTRENRKEGENKATYLKKKKKGVVQCVNRCLL